MNPLKQWLFQTLLILLILAPLSPMQAAQVDTPEPTPEATPIVVPDPQPDTDAGDIEQILKIAGLIIAGIVTGSLATIGGVIALIRAIRKDPEKMALIERLYDSRPDDTRARIRGGIEAVKEAVALADEATDGVPLRNKEPVG